MRSVLGWSGVCGLVLAAGLAAGCNKDCAPPTASAGGSPDVLPEPRATTDSKDVTVSVVRYPALEEAVTKNKGKVVLVDFWATFCGPCKKKFPYFVELHQKYAKDGLVCVSVSVDDPEDKAEVQKFLVEHKAAFPNFVIKATNAEEKQMGQKFAYDGTLPQMALFGKDGALVWDSNTKPIREKDPKDYMAKVEALVKAELAKKAAE